ncbi:hypothetical protein [Parvibaculum sp.]|jgi:hypothetical protein|uniref:hypothetical protein n=1 Tax=Parvibaculum sp. TaxID=2024848 RepID=UPI000C4E0668|nr:hypothetical protein [Parvibaculum sp.]HAC60043.1 hypothetical protein [Rhodobiaceae bacterium]MAU61944.1 hypothetical protein [Parvibaculum sp.]MBO6666836.1 hypothetical protein [Parvibaculum sp.]MBO6691646.1 hypothetical protein [Parvibaculum sp.]MBO6713457.1 hypothetical protein [Parvibaculum sp.]|tara:strand:+ start:526 stop:798 length:273 start_codon:yes stop_codon:yes gene_type:complete
MGNQKRDSRQVLAKVNDDPENEGEGSRSAARAYNRDQQEFVKEGRVGEAAEAARSAVEDDRRDLEKAEKEGKRRAAEHDPEEVRDYRKPE